MCVRGCRKPPIHRHPLPTHITGRRRQQKRHQTRHLFRLSRPPGWCGLQHSLQVFPPAKPLLRHRRHNRPRIHRIDAHPMGKILQRRTARQPQHRMLAGGVNRAIGKPHLRHHRRRVDNRPAALGAQHRNLRLHRPEHRLHIGQHHLGKIRRAQGVQGAGAAQHAGIVKRAIQPAKLGDGGVHQARVFGFHGDVGRACPGLAACRAHLGGHVFQQVGAPRRQGQLRARTAQEPRGGGANAGRRASDQKALASQVSQKRGHVMRSCVGKIVHTG